MKTLEEIFEKALLDSVQDSLLYPLGLYPWNEIQMEKR